MVEPRGYGAGAVYMGITFVAMAYGLVAMVIGVVITLRDGEYGFAILCAVLALVAFTLCWLIVRWFRRG